MRRWVRVVGWLLLVAAVAAPGAVFLGSAHAQQPPPKKDGFGEMEPIEPAPTPVPTLAPLPTEAPAPATAAASEPAKKAEPSPAGLPQEPLIVLSLGGLGVNAEELWNLGGDEPVRGAVCAVTLDLVLVGDFLVQRIGARCLRQLLEEGGVEDINLRDLRE